MGKVIQSHLGDLVRGTCIAMFGWGAILMTLTALQVTFSRDIFEYEAYGVSALLMAGGLARAIASHVRIR